jgi:predicted  nucleic acid-binding Zn-ribbon protein
MKLRIPGWILALSIAAALVQPAFPQDREQTLRNRIKVLKDWEQGLQTNMLEAQSDLAEVEVKIKESEPLVNELDKHTKTLVEKRAEIETKEKAVPSCWTSFWEGVSERGGNVLFWPPAWGDKREQPLKDVERARRDYESALAGINQKLATQGVPLDDQGASVTFRDMDHLMREVLPVKQRLDVEYKPERARLTKLLSNLQGQIDDIRAERLDLESQLRALQAASEEPPAAEETEERPPEPGTTPPATEERPERPEAPTEIRIIHPSPEELAQPYEPPPTEFRGEKAVRLYDVNMVVEVPNLGAGLHSLHMHLARSGGRYLWCRVKPGQTDARFEGFVPVPYGRFEMTLSVPGRPQFGSKTIRGEMKRGTLPFGEDYLKDRIDDIKSMRGELSQEPDPEQRKHIYLRLSSSLRSMAYDYLIMGLNKESGEISQEALECLEASGAGLSHLAKQECYEQMAAIAAFDGNVRQVNEQMKKVVDSVLDWIRQMQAQGGSMPTSLYHLLAKSYWKWARMVAQLSDDLTSARKLWNTGADYARMAGKESPAPPVWLTE